MKEINYSRSVATISALLDKYSKSGRFTEEIVKSVKDTLEGQELKIAVIGKMKAGKSSFSNALLFHDNVLPSGMAPTTITLTEIAYTDNPAKDSKVEVELLTMSDINSIQANINSNNPRISSIAKEMWEKIDGIAGGYEQYLSKGKVEIDLNNLVNFTSAGGTLSGLAKKVTIYKNIEILKGLKIIDTPGFNDPVQSRTEVTRNAIKDSHIILFVHDYLDKYDEDEVEILVEQVDCSGVSMLVDIINKIDCLESNQWSKSIYSFERKKEEAKKQIKNKGIEELLSKGEVTYMSSLMALVGYEVDRMGQNCSEISKDLFIEYQYNFPELKLVKPCDFIEHSNIYEIIDIINKISTDKNKYLENYPIQNLIGQLKDIKSMVEKNLSEKDEQLNVLQLDELTAKAQLSAVNDIFAELKDKMDGLVLATNLRNCISKTKSEIINDRKTIAEVAFAEYEMQGNLFNSAPERRNLARYKNTLTDFDNMVRNKLEALKDQFVTESEAYINNLLVSLVAPNISLEQRNNLASFVISLLNSEISKGLPIVVNPDEPANCLYGEVAQDSLYKSDFLGRRKDSVIEDSYLKIFNSFVDNTIDCKKGPNVLADAIANQIEKLKAGIKSAIEYSPAEMQKQKQMLDEEIKELKKEIKDVSSDIESLEKLKSKK